MTKEKACLSKLYAQRGVSDMPIDWNKRLRPLSTRVTKDKEYYCGSRGGCKNPGTEELHSCPYAEDIDDDHEKTCRCCADCTDECAQDI